MASMDTSVWPRSDSSDLSESPESDTLTPLYPSLRAGLTAISVLAFLSFVAASILWLYITFKVIWGSLKRRFRVAAVAHNLPVPPIGAEFTAEEREYGPSGRDAKTTHQENITQLVKSRCVPPNQFLILIHHLFLADMHQSASFLLSAIWLHMDGIFVNERTCFVQGFFDSNGDLASSCFITAIAIHTYLSVARGWQPSYTVLYLCIAGIWIFVYSMSTIPLLATNYGAAHGGYFVRAGAWCWINDGYENLRLVTHYLFIFIALATTSSLYTAIYISLKRQADSIAVRNYRDGTKLRLSHKRAFLVYPLIYVMCTLPLAVGRICAMAGVDPPTEYYCFAGCLIASNGLLDCILFGTTRHSIVFGNKDGVEALDTGLETFAFMRTPANQRYGNSIWVQGGNDRLQDGYTMGGWWRSLSLFGGGVGSRLHGSSGISHGRTVSEESLRGAGRNDLTIQMDVVTSVAVETEEHGKGDRLRYPPRLTDQSPSLSSEEREFQKLP